MALPPWTIELLRRGISDVARKASEPQTLAKLKSQATEILQELPETAARGINAVMQSAEAGKNSLQRWTRKQTELAIPMLNASGVLLTESGTGVALAESVANMGREFASGDIAGGPALEDKIARRISKVLPGDGDAIAVTSNFSAALTAFSLLVQETQLVIHRNHSVRLPDGRPLPEAFGMLVPVIHEVGAVGHVSAADFAGLDDFCAILADNGLRPVELLQLENRDFLQAVVLNVGTIQSTSIDSIPSAAALRKQGADFVILRGGGVNQGPECGVIIGRKEGIEAIKKSVAWPTLVASDAVQAMLVVAMEAAHADQPTPLKMLLETSEENLKGRAERLATRLSGSDSIASCQVTNDDAKLTSDGRWHFPSRQVRLRHANHQAAEWSERLADQLPAVLSCVDGEDLKVDLRWIAAADDSKLAEALVGKAEPAPPTEKGQGS